MKHVFPIDELQPGQWLLAGAGDAWSLRAGVADRGRCDEDRLLIVVRGAVRLSGQGESLDARGEAALFIPAGGDRVVEPSPDAVFLELRVPASSAVSSSSKARVLSLAPEGLQGSGFAWKSLIDRTSGSHGVRANLMQVDPGAGSPDWHIHAFDQFYVVLQGSMRVEVGRRTMDVTSPSLVLLPAGCVHRNWNASSELERHVAFLIPEPAEGEIFDYAVEIHGREAEMMGTR